MHKQHPTRLISLKLLFQLLLGFLLVTSASASFAHHPHDPVNGLVVSPVYNDDQTLYISNSDHLFKSVDGGHSWKELVNGLDHNHSISSIVFGSANKGASTVYFSTLGDGVYRSTDNGASWQAINTSLKNREISALATGAEGRLLALDTAGGLHFTATGDTWQAAVIPEGIVVTAVSTQAHTPDTGLLAGGSLGQILVSKDNGKNWQSAGQLPVETGITVIAFDPSDTSGSTYFAGTQDQGLYRTTDNGSTFERLDKGLLSTDPVLSLTFSPAYTQDHTLVATTWHEAAFISSDGGDSWKNTARV